MKKFQIYIPAEYVMGRLRYGHGEGIVEAESKEEILKKLKTEEADDILDYIHLEVDDWDIDDYEYDFSSMKVEEIE